MSRTEEAKRQPSFSSKESLQRGDKKSGVQQLRCQGSGSSSTQSLHSNAASVSNQPLCCSHFSPVCYLKRCADQPFRLLVPQHPSCSAPLPVSHSIPQLLIPSGSYPGSSSDPLSILSGPQAPSSSKLPQSHNLNSRICQTTRTRSSANHSCDIWIVRHGETAENTTRTIAGHNSGGLTPAGVQQANLLAERLQQTKFDVIFVSDLCRTKQTAEIILQLQPAGTWLQEDPRLREKGGGDFEGKPLGTCEKMAKKNGISMRSYRAPGGGESWVDVCTRSRSFMQTLSKSITVDQLQRVLVVTHGGWIKEFINAHVPAAKAGNTSKNCSISILKAAGSSATNFRFQVVSWNDAAHLKEIGDTSNDWPGDLPPNEDTDASVGLDMQAAGLSIQDSS